MVSTDSPGATPTSHPFDADGVGEEAFSSHGWGLGHRGHRGDGSGSTDPEMCAEATAAWVIGALDTTDRDRHEAHLEACATCQTEACNHADAIEALAATVDQVDPPLRLRRAITTHARVALTLETG